MALHKVTKEFDHAEDGMNVRTVKVGEDININPAHVAGLVEGGYIAAGDTAETLSKLAGEQIKNADLSEVVGDTAAVADKIDTAEAGISDGHIGAPEAQAIVDENRVIETLPETEGNVPEADKPAADKKSSAKK